MPANSAECASSPVAPQPDRRRHAEHGAAGKRSEVATVERVANTGAEDKQQRGGHPPTALPSGQRAPAAVAGERNRGKPVINGDLAAKSTHALARPRCNAFQKWHPLGKIATRCKPSGQRPWRSDQDQVASSRRPCRIDGVKPDRSAARRIPHQARERWRKRRSNQTCDAANRHEKPAQHEQMPRRRCQARWREAE